ncbi:MAG: PadR family transcriptional regulator [Geminicoccaceae bacterium]
MRFSSHHSHAHSHHGGGGRRHARPPRHDDDLEPRGRHGRHGPHGGRGGRPFAQGDLRLLILHLIAQKPRHGYEVIKAIEEDLAGAYSPSPGIVYPTLTMLEEMGQAAQEPGEGGRKLYAITDAGRAALAESAAAVQALLARMQAVRASGGDGPPAPLVRAMENLKLALRLRLARGDLDAERIRALAAGIDALALEIERS